MENYPGCIYRTPQYRSILPANTGLDTTQHASKVYGITAQDTFACRIDFTPYGRHDNSAAMFRNKLSCLPKQRLN